MIIKLMKQFLYTCYWVLIAIIGMMAGVNRYVDPANLYNGLEREISDILCDGHNVTDVPKLSNRSLKAQMIRCCEGQIDTVVLGSSRPLLLGSDNLQIRTLNLAVPGGTLYDVIGMYQRVCDNRSLQESMERVIIGVEPWFFYHEKGVNRGKFFESDIDKWTKLVSPYYFQESIRQLREPSDPGETEFTITCDKQNINMTYHADGSIEYSEKYRTITPEIVEQRVREDITTAQHKSFRNKSIDPELRQDFELFLKELNEQAFNEKKVEVVLLLIPFHPMVYKESVVKSKTPFLEEVETLARTKATEYSFKIAGSYDPLKANMEHMDFYDGIHLSHAGLEKFLNLPVEHP